MHLPQRLGILGSRGSHRWPQRWQRRQTIVTVPVRLIMHYMYHRAHYGVNTLPLSDAEDFQEIFAQHHRSCHHRRNLSQRQGERSVTLCSLAYQPHLQVTVTTLGILCAIIQPTAYSDKRMSNYCDLLARCPPNLSHFRFCLQCPLVECVLVDGGKAHRNYQIRELRDGGMSVIDVADKLGIGVRTVIRAGTRA